MEPMAPPGSDADQARFQHWVLPMAGLALLASLLPMSQERPIQGYWFRDFESMWIAAWEVERPHVWFHLSRFVNDVRFDGWAEAFPTAGIALAGPLLSMGVAGQALVTGRARWGAWGAQAAAPGVYAVGLWSRNIHFAGGDALDDFALMPGFYLLTALIIAQGVVLGLGDRSRAPA